MKQLFLLFTFSLFLPLFSFGNNCTIDVTPSSGTQACIGQGGFMGQAFLSCQTGLWTDLTFNIPALWGTGSYTLYIARGNTADNTLSGVKSFGPYTTAGVINVNPNLYVDSGESLIFWVELTGFHTVCFDGTNNFNQGFVHSGLRSPSPATSMAGLTNGSGSLVTTPAGAGSANPHQSLAFNVSIQRKEVPSLSEWGLLIFGLLTINLGLFFVKKKEEVLQ